MSQQRKKNPKLKSSTPEYELLHFLDTISVKKIKDAQEWKNQFLSFQASCYNDLAFQRYRIIDELKNAVREVSISQYVFSEWSRVVDYNRSIQPLSSKGSIIDPAGRRFNVGDLDPSRFPPFPALYLAKDQDTSLIEKFGGKNQSDLDTALRSSGSFTLVKLEGELESVFDLRKEENLKPFYKLIQNIEFPKYLIRTAKIWDLKSPKTVKSVSQLFKTLLEKNWRYYPMQCDIPSGSQIFGQIVESAGIQGILYYSVKNHKECLAVFPKNFQNSNSYVQLMDKPVADHTIKRLDCTNWEKLI